MDLDFAHPDAEGEGARVAPPYHPYMRRWLKPILICLVLGTMTTVAVAWGCAIVFQWRFGPVSNPAFIAVRDQPMPLDYEYLRPLPIEERPGCLLNRRVAGSADQLWRDFSHYIWIAKPDLARSYVEAIVATTSPVDFIIMISNEPDRARATLARANVALPRDLSALLQGHVNAGLATIGLADISGNVEAHPSRDLSKDYRLAELRAGWPASALKGKVLHVHASRSGIPKAVKYHSGLATLPDALVERWHASAVPVTAIASGFLIDTLFYSVLWFGFFFGFGAMKRALRTRRGRCPNCAYDLRGGTPQAGRLCHRIQGCPECGWNRNDDQRRNDDQPPSEAGG